MKYARLTTESTQTLNFTWVYSLILWTHPNLSSLMSLTGHQMLRDQCYELMWLHLTLIIFLSKFMKHCIIVCICGNYHSLTKNQVLPSPPLFSHCSGFIFVCCFAVLGVELRTIFMLSNPALTLLDHLHGPYDTAFLAPDGARHKRNNRFVLLTMEKEAS